MCSQDLFKTIKKKKNTNNNNNADTCLKLPAVTHAAAAAGTGAALGHVT